MVETLSSLDLESSSTNPADRALLNYAIKLTEDPSAVKAEDAELLRAEGFDDRAIHDLCQVVAYFNYVNRIADGLGVELEKRFTDV